MNIPLNRYWWLFLTRGFLAIVLGVLVLLMPGVTFTFLVILLGAYMLLDGIFSIVTTLADRSNRRGRGWMLGGLLSVLVGVLVLSNPFTWVVALVYIVAIWALAAGIIEIIAAVRLRHVIKGEGWYIAVGILTFLFGLSLLINPLAGVITLSFVFAFYVFISGSLLVSLAFRLRRRYKSMEVHEVSVV
ncbi:MAG TPA: HdeD family acid-resistance protein [Chitinophagaceae bacterium]|jgi:uncharacterized membrane protein HdeD (DUF308 family)